MHSDALCVVYKFFQFWSKLTIFQSYAEFWKKLAKIETLKIG